MKSFFIPIFYGYVEGRVKEEYVPSKHLSNLSKFLYWNNEEGGLLLVTNCGNHRDLPYCASLLFDRESNESIQVYKKPDGCGNIEKGRVSSWVSEGYQITTPEDLRPAIIEALGIQK